MLIKLIAESALCRDAQVSRQLKRSRQLMTGRLKKLTVGRFAGGVVGGILLPAAVAFQDPVDVSLVWPMAVLLVCLLAETCERYLFFAAVSPDRMPQGLHS